MSFRFSALRAVARATARPAMRAPARQFVLARSTASLIASSQRRAAIRFSTAVRSAFEASESPASGSSADAADRPSVYVGNIYFSSTEQDMKAHFAQFGAVDEVSLAVDMRGSSRGFGFVFYKSSVNIDEVIKLADQSSLGGRQLLVKQHLKRPPGPRAVIQSVPSETLYIGNMPYSITDKDIYDLVSGLPGAKKVRVAVDRISGHPRGFAHVDFQSVAEAESALKFLSERDVGGRALRVDFARSATRDTSDNNLISDRDMSVNSAESTEAESPKASSDAAPAEQQQPTATT